jgi:precorrin-8X/cobalt-precorrin-8 methylmutase
MTTGRLFDRYVVVDWSANGRPVRGRDSIWVAVAGRSGPIEVSNPSTRRRAESILGELLDDAADRRERTLVGVDASLGFPAGTADCFAVPGAEPWRAMWTHLERRLVDDDHNRNDRFAVAAELNRRRGASVFWGCPAGRIVEGLGPRKPAVFPVEEFRAVEAVLRAEGLRPASVWQLLGVGSVGSQTLTVLPVLERLLRRGGIEVWPFASGAVPPVTEAGSTVVVEVWPTVFTIESSAHAVRDAAQVVSVAAQLRRADDRDELGGWFEPVVPGASGDAVRSEEGWILRPPAPVD